MAELSEAVKSLLDEILPPDGGKPDLRAIQLEAAEVRRCLSQPERQIYPSWRYRAFQRWFHG